MPTAYITCPPEWADDLATALVEDRLAACVNVVECRSTYRWDGNIEREGERILLCKTTDERYGDLVERARELHPHDVPCIERFDAVDVDGAYADWVAAATDVAG